MNKESERESSTELHGSFKASEVSASSRSAGTIGQRTFQLLISSLIPPQKHLALISIQAVLAVDKSYETEWSFVLGAGRC